MAAKIRVGIMGATVTPGGSGWGANAHVRALKALPAYELKAVCTAQPETASASAAAFGANLAEAEAMAVLASTRRLRTAVGLQARSDPPLMYAREVVQQGVRRRGIVGKLQRDQPDRDPAG